MDNETDGHIVDKSAGEGEREVTATLAKVPVHEFVRRAIIALRKEGEGRLGIHTVYSGFNDAFKRFYGPGADPLAAVDELVAQGLIEKRVCRGGAAIYLKGDLAKSGNSGEGALAKMGLEDNRG